MKDAALLAVQAIASAEGLPSGKLCYGSGVVGPQRRPGLNEAVHAVVVHIG